MDRSETSTTPKVELVASHVGAQGDAVAELAGRRVFIPFALPGERLRATIRPRSGDELHADDLEILAPSPDRVAAPCRHFGICGGCKLQHWAAEPYRTWKLDMVRAALRQRGLDFPERVESVFLPAGNRRRAEFAALKQGGRVEIGFQEARSHRIADQQECPVLLPVLADLVSSLRAMLAEALAEGQAVDILATATATGLDLGFGADRAATQRQRVALAGFAERHDIARLTWRAGRGEAEPIAMLRSPQIRFGDVVVDLPSPSFLQPSEAGEAALRSAMLSFLAKPKRIAELYAGCGTFTFDLARYGQVIAVEGGKAALLALDHAARRAQLGHRISTVHRDLARSPLSIQELKPFDSVVFDPPRAGAKAQCAVLARSQVNQIVAVSCNSATFARDAEMLAAGEYLMTGIVVVDQFIWSPHVEIVAGFRRHR